MPRDYLLYLVDIELALDRIERALALALDRIERAFALT